MTVLSAQSIRWLCDADLRPRTAWPYSRRGHLPLVEPFCERTVFHGSTFGLSPAGYDIRLAQNVRLQAHQRLYPENNTPNSSFHLASSIEKFSMPDNVIGIVHDKSTWARHGLAVQNTVIEPGWTGFLTLELTMHGTGIVNIPAGSPIAQVVFHWLDLPTAQPYAGKYMNQEAGPQPARMEE